MNKIVIDGVTIELTEEQTEKLRAELGVKKRSPFDRVEHGEYFYSIDISGRITSHTDERDTYDNAWYNSANYCTDKDLLTERARVEVLSRLLWRFSMENGGDKIDWEDSAQPKYYVHDKDAEWRIDCAYLSRKLQPHFITREIAQRAIDEIVIPFEKGKLPCCKIWEV